ncbi:MAG: DNA alkylation repair protein [Propionibacteriaceae bacterium]|nr:DNA alkylation repair protein [Propionibacteriaceae bacterium]
MSEATDSVDAGFRVADGVVAAVRAGLLERADPEVAPGQQRYMKSAMPFHGVRSPEVRRLVRELVREHGPFADREVWEQAVRSLWDEAGHREERYAALALARHPKHRAFADDPRSLALYRHFVLTGQWWDLCDETAHLVGRVLAAQPVEITPILRDWSREENLWIRRVAIIAQLDRKGETDVDLLAYAIEGSIADRDFFARKGIGWALRQHSKTDPAWVRAFVAAHPDLSGLSVREALRLLPN